jgi:hypothetical protein
MAPLASQQSTNTAPACGETLTQLSASGVLSVNVATGAEPGATDPMAVPAGRYTLLRDDEVLAFQPSASLVKSLVLTTDKGGTSLAPATYDINAWDSSGWGPPAYFPAAGRFLKPQSDDALWAARSGNPNMANGAADITFFGGYSGKFFKTFSTTLPGTLLPRQQNFTDFMAIGAADLDEFVGSDAYLHDEAVVAKVSSQNSDSYTYDVDVVNYSSGEITNPDTTAIQFSTSKPTFQTNPNNGETGLLPSGDNIVSVVTGDFLGTGQKETAVLALANGTLELRTFRYQTTGSGHQLTQIGTFSFDLVSSFPSGNPQWQGKPIVGTLSAAAGDFDGDGADEIAVGYAKWRGKDPVFPSYATGMVILKYDSSFKATVKNNSILWSENMKQRFTSANLRPVVAVVSGQFLIDPPSIPYGRKQIVVGWRTVGYQSAGIALRAYSVSTDLRTVTPMGVVPFRLPAASPFLTFSMAAGGFEGASGKLPIHQLAMSSWYGGTTGLNGPTYSQLSTYRVNQNGISLWQQSTTNGSLTGVGPDERMRVPVIAYDGHGNSRYLGAPVRLTSDLYPTVDYVMQEPPKHAYWDEDKHKIENLTRFDGNNVHLSKGETATFKTETKSESSRDTGGSTAASAGATVKAGTDFGIAKVGTEVSADVTLRGSYDYNEHKESYDSQYQDRTVKSSGQTDRDDYLKGQAQSFDIWRYRVYGTPTSTNSNGFYELVLPGRTTPFEGGGANFYWYQPIQENGNILSYPPRLGPGPDPHMPADMSTFTLPGNDKKQYSEPLVPPTQQRFDATSGSTSLEFNNEITRTNAFSFLHSIGESADVRVTMKGTAETRLGGSEVRACGSMEFHNTNSWGGNNSATSTTNDQTAVEFNRSKGSRNTAYPFYPVVYNTKEGALKMAFAMPNPASPSSNFAGFQTYATLYGGTADPALNLPYHFEPISKGSGEVEEWEPNLHPKRKEMRGLFFRHSTVDPVAKTYLQWAANPKSGDIVRIEPRIYNYSTGIGATNIGVAFQVIGYDSGTNSEICDAPINAAAGKTGGLVCPRSARTTIGNATVRQLNPLQFTCISGYDDPVTTGCAPSVFLDWNTANFGPSFSTNEYRVYVVLTVQGSETYGLEPNPISITDVANANAETKTPMVVTAPGSNLDTGAYVIIGGVQGLNKANGTFAVTRLSKDQFALHGTVPSPGEYTGGGTVSILDPGQNDEGYGLIGITAVPALTATDDPVPHDYLNSNSLQAPAEDAPADDGSTQGQESGITAIQGVPLELRFTAYSSMVHADSAQVMLFDGDLAERNPAIADQLIHPGAHGSDGTTIWFTWTPTTVGQHHLYAALVEGPQQNQPAAELEVNVIPLQPSISVNGGRTKSRVR